MEAGEGLKREELGAARARSIKTAVSPQFGIPRRLADPNPPRLNEAIKGLEMAAIQQVGVAAPKTFSRPTHRFRQSCMFC
jgi:hypothetical protein